MKALFPFLAVLSTAVWLLVDPDAERTLASFFDLDLTRPLESLKTISLEVGYWPSIVTPLLALVFVAVFSVELTKFTGIRKRNESIRSLLRCLLVAALWFGLLTQYTDLAWIGKRFRSRGYTARLNQLADDLRTDWPLSDGEIKSIGPFTSYPEGHPSILLLLSPYPVEGTETVISAIERSENGSLRFQLGGAERGAWLEWHDSGSRPVQHINGLSERREVGRFSKLGDHWYVVRYGTPSDGA